MYKSKYSVFPVKLDYRAGYRRKNIWHLVYVVNKLTSSEVYKLWKQETAVWSFFKKELLVISINCKNRFCANDLTLFRS